MTPARCTGTMRAQLEVSAGAGALRASVAFEREQEPQRTGHLHRWVALVIALLVVPFSVALAVDAVSYTVRGVYALPPWLFGAADPGPGRLLALGPPLALLILAGLRVRIHARRSGGRVSCVLSARLTRWELGLGVVALAVAAVFVVHDLADSIGCARGIRSAC